MNELEFKVGDQVIIKETKYQGSIVQIDMYNNVMLYKVVVGHYYDEEGILHERTNFKTVKEIAHLRPEKLSYI